MIKQQQKSNQDDSYTLLDLLADERADNISEYLSLSIEQVGENTKVNVVTVEDIPFIYSDILTGVSLNGLQCLDDMS